MKLYLTQNKPGVGDLLEAYCLKDFQTTGGETYANVYKGYYSPRRKVFYYRQIDPAQRPSGKNYHYVNVNGRVIGVRLPLKEALRVVQWGKRGRFVSTEPSSHPRIRLIPAANFRYGPSSKDRKALKTTW